ncbi:hypothetical protein [Salibaculum halophilum]|uniref:hypothetical protein n=1 Tax=Salibaculum halophilum TaxID=1914408 RepID=UPI000A10DF23|nr:hypothetical protein [Salibaculum halophilum]
MGQRGATSPVMITALSLALLAGCGGDGTNPFQEETDGQTGGGADPDAGGGDGTGGEAAPDGGVSPDSVPDNVGNNVQSVNYDEASGTFRVTVNSLDTTPRTATYDRTPQLDVPGYTAFSVQEDPLDRFFIGLAATSSDDTSSGAVVLDGGQFNKVFGGAYFERNGPYSPHVPEQPANGLVSYAGDYAGLSNLTVADGNPDNLLAAVPAGTDPELHPAQPSRVTGQVFLNADFSDGSVNGAIFDRVLEESATSLPSVVLVPEPGNLDGQAGTFTGTVETPEQDPIGDYAGVFGGEGATSMSGGISIEGYLDNVENELEYGVFVLTKCGEPGDAALCDTVNPDALP